MKGFLLALSAIMPLFFPMAAGYLLKQINLIDNHTVKGMNKAVFRFFLPLLLCCNVYHSDLSNVFDKRLMIFGIIGVFIAFFLFFAIVRITEKKHEKQGVMIQGMFRSNFVLFGLPLATQLCSEDELGVTALMIAVVVPLYNVLSVITLEICRGGVPNVKKIIKGILTNPLIISSLLGLVILFIGIPVPKLIDQSLSSMASVATPLALFLLGASFRFSGAKNSLRQLITVLLGKLVLLPGIMLTIGYFMGFRGVAMTTLLAMFASPTAVSSFVMAQEMEGDAELASQIVVWTSTFALLTIFCFLMILKRLGGI